MKNYNIHFIAEKDLSKEEMASRYENADVVLFPSLYEGFGLPVIEGFKAGRAVVTSEISPLKELADGAAWLVDPYSVQSIRNSLERIIKDDETRERKVQSGLKLISRYSPDIIASLYHQAYAELRLPKIMFLASVAQYLL